MKHFHIFVFLSLSIMGISQSPTDSILNDSKELVFVNRSESQPVHISGNNEKLISTLYDNLTFPKGKRIEGMTILTFRIDTMGNVVDPKISRSVDLHIDRQLLKEIRNHTFIPGKLYGKKVETTMTIPIHICSSE